VVVVVVVVVGGMVVVVVGGRVVVVAGGRVVGVLLEHDAAVASVRLAVDGGAVDDVCGDARRYRN
jgi:hypothetical protein